MSSNCGHRILRNKINLACDICGLIQRIQVNENIREDTPNEPIYDNITEGTSNEPIYENLYLTPVSRHRSLSVDRILASIANNTIRNFPIRRSEGRPVLFRQNSYSSNSSSNSSLNSSSDSSSNSSFSDTTQDISIGTLNNFENNLRRGYEENMDQNNIIRNLKVRPPTYTGSKTDVNIKNFFSKLDKFFISTNLDRDDYTAALGLCLEGDALEVYDSLNRNNDLEYLELKEQLISYFDNEQIELLVRSKIAKRKLRAGESVNEYFHELRRLAVKIGMSDSELLHAFIEGLPETYAAHIVTSNPESPTEAFNLAKTLEQVKSLYKGKSGLEEIKMAKIEAATASSSIKEDEVSTLKNDFQTFKIEIMEMLQKVDENNQNQQTQYSNNFNGHRSGNSYRQNQYNGNNFNQASNNNKWRSRNTSYRNTFSNKSNQNYYHNFNTSTSNNNYTNNRYNNNNNNNNYNNNSTYNRNNNNNNNNSYNNNNNNSNNNYNNNNNNYNNNNNNNIKSKIIGFRSLRLTFIDRN